MKRMKLKALFTILVALLAVGLNARPAQAAARRYYLNTTNITMTVGETRNIMLSRPYTCQRTVFRYNSRYTTIQSKTSKTYSLAYRLKGVKAGSYRGYFEIKDKYSRATQKLYFNVIVKNKVVPIPDKRSDTTPQPTTGEAYTRSLLARQGKAPSYVYNQTVYLATCVNGVNTNGLLDVDKSDTTGNGKIQVWGYVRGSNAQRWQITHLGNNVYKVINVNSGLALEDRGWSTTDGTILGQWGWHGGDCQKWFIVRVGTANGHGVYQFVNVHSGKAMSCASSRCGTQIRQYTTSNAASQQWTFWK